MALNDIISGLNGIAAEQHKLSDIASDLANQAAQSIAAQGGASAGQGFFITGLTVFALACFVGYYVVWRVTPALHSPLMAVTNAVSSVIIVGALLAAGPVEMTSSKAMGLVAVGLASINIFGGFIVTGRMLAMYKKKTTGNEKAKK
jgi:NAD(P) transhydrogenase subunit alpha